MGSCSLGPLQGFRNDKLTDVENHDSDDEEVQSERGRAAIREGLSRADEETSTDGTTDSNHVQVARLHGPLQLDQAGAIKSLLEGLSIEAITRVEVGVALNFGDLADGAMNYAAHLVDLVPKGPRGAGAFFRVDAHCDYEFVRACVTWGFGFLMELSDGPQPAKVDATRSDDGNRGNPGDGQGGEDQTNVL